MTIIDDLPPKTVPNIFTWRGRFATTPNSVSQLVDVILPDFSGALRWKNCRWEPRLKPKTIQTSSAGSPSHQHNVEDWEYLFPKRLDPCLCVFDNQRHIWVVMWWPY